MASKSLFITYLLWLFSGFFGTHHFYLGRDYQALVWWLFCGGGLGLGWLRDIWRIPDYVRDANDDAFYLEELALKMRKHERPPFKLVRFFCQQVVAQSFGFLAMYAIPKNYFYPQLHTTISAILVPFCTGVGTYIVGNIGREKGSLKLTLLHSFMAIPLFFMFKEPIYITTWISTFCFDKYVKKWRRTPKQQSFFKRILKLSMFGLLYFALWSSYLHFNCMVMINEEEGFRCSDAVTNIFTSQVWKDLLLALKSMISDIKQKGWESAWTNFVNGAFRHSGTVEALEVLNLTSSATQQEITSRYREYVRYYHPDKNHDPEKAQFYMDRFIEIQRAYEILSDVKIQRTDKNVQEPSHKNFTADFT